MPNLTCRPVRGLSFVAIAFAIIGLCFSPPTQASDGLKTMRTATGVRNFPNDTGMINVKTAFGAIGNGLTDDTQAIRNAIQATVGTHGTLFFPAGTYLVSQQLDWRNGNGEWRSYLTFQGAGIGQTIFRLKDGANGFGDNANPRPIFRPGSKTDDPACSNYANNSGNGDGNCAFGNYLFDLTIDAGNSNPGAVALDFTASNYGAVENVKLTAGTGSGFIGLDLRRSPGPCQIKNVSVTGFDYGVYAAGELYSITFENITLNNQHTAGLQNDGNALQIRNLTSTNSQPAIVNTGIGMVTILDSVFNGGNANQSAIANTGQILGRNLISTGYQSVISDHSNLINGTTVSEYVSATPQKLFDSPLQTLNLPIRDTPDLTDDTLSNWANVESFGAIKNDGQDDAAAIQSAIDSGKSTIYLPWGNYTINQTVIVRGNVKRIIGFSSSIGGTASPFFRVQSLTNPAVSFERFDSSTLGIEQASDQATVVKHTQGVALLSSDSGRGNWFLEDYCCGSFSVKPNHAVWARQLNVEGSSTPLVTNNGGLLWILGLKTEGTRTNIQTNGGQTELLGGIIYDVGGDHSPSFINQDGAVSLTFTEVSYSSDAQATNFVEEVRGSSTPAYLPRSAAQWHGLGGIIPLYSGCDALRVTLTRDGSGCSSLRFALQNAGQNGLGTTISIQPSAPGPIYVRSGLPAVPVNVTLAGSCGPAGPAVTIDGTGVSGRGFKLLGHNILQGLRIQGFNGRQIVATGGANRFECVAAGR